MNSWIGGGLSSLKGQLTHLITEGTEDVSDPNSDLIVAKQKISDLENQIRSSSLDVKELTERNNELKIKLQSEEMLLQSVSDSYKEKLKQKEECIESLREQLSSSASYLDNSGQNNASLMHNDAWHNEIFDFVNDSTMTSSINVTEADSLRQRIQELSQEVLRWRTVAEAVQSEGAHCNDDSMNESLAKLLEIQRQDLELQHSNYILELQQEHSKQLNYWRRRDRKLSSMSDNDECDQYESRDSQAVPTDTHRVFSVTTSDIGTDTSGLSTLCAVACQVPIEYSQPDLAISDSVLSRMAPVTSHTFGDAMSQVSDVSEVSVKSHLLSEHVRHLSSRIDEYGNQLTGLDDIALTTDHDNDPDHLVNKLQHLKLKLSQRKNVLLEQNHAITNKETLEQESANCADSWENSSDNSLVHESTVELKQAIDLESQINELYNVLYLHYPENNTSAIDTIGAIKDRVTDVVKRIENEEFWKESLYSFYNELGGSSHPKEDVESIIHRLRVMFEKKSANDDAIRNLDQEKCVLEEEIVELTRKNSELEEKLDDMSSTIIRYESLEKVCDRYEKELLELKGCGEKTDLGMDSEDILEHVKTFNEEKDECIEKLESRIISLQNFCEEKDDYIKAMKEREVEIIYEYDCSIRVLSNELDNVRTIAEKAVENENELKKELCRLNLCISEKDEMINSLNEELTMLSHQNTDDDMLVLTRNTTTTADYSSQTDSVSLVEYGEECLGVNEQTSCLMAENKRLEEVVEAQANSLGLYEARVNTLDSEISRLSRSSDGVVDSASSEDMTRETLHHLSQMIRDKEWEIDALKSKNESLCDIIKQSSTTSEPDSVYHFEKLLNEKEALSKEILWYQENREQLVNALNLKHKESLNYHGEIQRLVAFINVEQTKWSGVSADNDVLKEEIRVLLAEKSAPKLVDTAVEFRDALPSYEECIEATANTEECRSLKERVAKLEMENRHSFDEVRRLEKQLERVSFELEETRLQFNELMESHNRCQSQMVHYQEELARICRADDASNQLVDAAKDIWNESTEVVTAVEEISVSNQVPVVEVAEQYRRHQLQCDDHIHQIEQLKAREMKLLKEKQIFQDHLIRIEESYTKDATIAEDREQNLRSQLRATEDKLSQAEERVAELEHKVTSMAGKFESETGDTRTERDDAIRKLRDTEAQLADTVQSLTNLQIVLDKFQQEQAIEMNFLKERLEQDLVSVYADRDKWASQCRQLQSSLDAQNDVVEAAQRLTDQMEWKDDQLAELQATMSRKEEVIDSLKMEIRKLNSVTESKVDKILMRNLVIGYFHTPTNKRQDALRVIGSLLQFSDQDYNQIGIDTVNKSRWFSWLRSTGTDTKDHDVQHTHEHSFSELFIRFLERESTPLPQLRLPTNQLAAEARQRSSLSQSDDLPYASVSSSQAPILDHHKFFTSSPMVTKRSGAPSDDNTHNIDNTTSTDDTSPPLLYISNLQEPRTDYQWNKDKPQAHQPSSHRRSDTHHNNRNALLSLLEQ